MRWSERGSRSRPASTSDRERVEHLFMLYEKMRAAGGWYEEKTDAASKECSINCTEWMSLLESNGNGLGKYQ